jgi:flagellar biosynthesis protein FlhB
MSEETGQEKTERPTERRLQEALKQGQILTSRDLIMSLVLLVGAAQIYFGGRLMFGELVSNFRRGLDFATPLNRDLPPLHVFGDHVLSAVITVVLFSIPLILVAIATQFALGGGMHVIWNNLAFKPSRLSPLNGLKRMFGVKGLIEVAKSIAKVIAVGAVGYILLKDDLPTILKMSATPFETAMEQSGNIIGMTLLIIAGAITLIGLVDGILQWRQHTNQMMMTRQEIKDENKQTEGSPEVKSRIRRLQQEAAQRGSVANVDQAQVVITNPQHFAIALRYDFEEGSAPKIVAKGTEQIAMSIREKADAAGIPVLEIPLLARALYYTSEIGAEIHADLYRAVATVLSFIFQAGPNAVMPDIDVPSELRFDQNGRKLEAAK